VYVRWPGETGGAFGFTFLCLKYIKPSGHANGVKDEVIFSVVITAQTYSCGQAGGQVVYEKT
jgi:hypothetical protein